jgi:hypothetical protein
MKQRVHLTMSAPILLSSFKSSSAIENVFPKATRGLLQRAQILANWPPIFIGKESDKHWEEGEDLSLLDFKAIQYRQKGNAVATDEQLV